MNLKRIIGQVVYLGIYPIFRLWIYNTNRAYVLIIFKGEIIVSQNWLGWKNEWALPGGGIKKDEDPKNAVVREVYEELKISLDPNNLIEMGRGFYRSRFASNYKLYKYIINERMELITCPEILRASYINKSHLNRHKLGETVKKALELAKWKI